MLIVVVKAAWLISAGLLWLLIDLQSWSEAGD